MAISVAKISPSTRKISRTFTVAGICVAKKEMVERTARSAIDLKRQSLILYSLVKNNYRNTIPCSRCCTYCVCYAYDAFDCVCVCACVYMVVYIYNLRVYLLCVAKKTSRARDL